jgi:alpha-galactosidase
MQLAVYLGIAFPEIAFRAAGINHLAWLTELTQNGQDLYPLLRQAARHPAVYEQDPARFEALLHFGAFISESSGHFSEYVPYFRKRPDLVKRYCREGYRGESGFYANNWPTWRAESDEQIRRVLAGKEQAELVRGVEYASYVIEAIESDRPKVIYGNVLNTGLIDNLLQDGVVEVACLVDRHGVQPTYFGALPPAMAALCLPHMVIHDLVSTAVLTRDRKAAFEALALDPLTAAVCSLEEIRQMFEEMTAAEAAYLPPWMHA